MKNKILLIIVSVLIVCCVLVGILLKNNKTFFSDKYIGVEKQEIYIPKYSYFKEECCMTVAVFYSLKSKKTLQYEIDNYLKDFEYFEDESTYGYMKDELFI